MTDTIVYTHTKLAAEVVKLKQEVAELRKLFAENHMMIMSLRGIINSWVRQVQVDGPQSSFQD